MTILTHEQLIEAEYLDCMDLHRSIAGLEHTGLAVLEEIERTNKSAAALVHGMVALARYSMIINERMSDRLSEAELNYDQQNEMLSANKD